MKIALIIIPVLLLSAFVVLFVLGLMSQSGEANGIVGNLLTKCPDKPNCVCSEYEADVSHYIEPIIISQSSATKVLSRLKDSVREMGGNIRDEKENYLAATFTSSLFRFVDDLEIRLDTGQKMIHLRSASRVGRGDGGINRNRVERLKNLFHLKAD